MKSNGDKDTRVFPLWCTVYYLIIISPHSQLNDFCNGAKESRTRATMETRTLCNLHKLTAVTTRDAPRRDGRKHLVFWHNRVLHEGGRLILVWFLDFGLFMWREHVMFFIRSNHPHVSHLCPISPSLLLVYLNPPPRPSCAGLCPTCSSSFQSFWFPGFKIGFLNGCRLAVS